ncbi:MAG: YybH family protein, partial [Candidatus Thorarchaeota archaeon]
MFKNSISTVLIALLLVFSMACEQKSKEIATLTETDISAVNKVLDAFNEGYLSGNLDAVMAVFSDDAVNLEFGMIYQGSEAIRNDHVKEELDNLTMTTFRTFDRVI